jgi:hypothetical protein
MWIARARGYVISLKPVPEFAHAGKSALCSRNCSDCRDARAESGTHQKCSGPIERPALYCSDSHTKLKLLHHEPAFDGVAVGDRAHPDRFHSPWQPVDKGLFDKLKHAIFLFRPEASNRLATKPEMKNATPVGWQIIGHERLDSECLSGEGSDRSDGSLIVPGEDCTVGGRKQLIETGSFRVKRLACAEPDASQKVASALGGGRPTPDMASARH